MNLSGIDVSKAVKDDKNLKLMHERFINELEKATLYKHNIGTINVSGTSIICECLGHKIITKHRPVAVNGNIHAMEYDFLVDWRGQELSILCLYLQKEGVITTDVRGAVKFYDVDNVYNKDNILTIVCSSLLVSPIFMSSEV